MPTVYQSVEEILQPIVEELEELLKARLKGVYDAKKRGQIFSDTICDRCSDIEETLREMLTEYDNGER
jgi:hypothetical protein